MEIGAQKILQCGEILRQKFRGLCPGIAVHRAASG
jgi:hypothetical protein